MNEVEKTEWGGDELTVWQWLKIKKVVLQETAKIYSHVEELILNHVYLGPEDAANQWSKFRFRNVNIAQKCIFYIFVKNVVTVLVFSI